MTTFAPESSMAYCSSSALHQALTGTEIAPRHTVAQKVMTHSGRFRMAMATRSPGTTPRARREAAKVATSA